MYADILMLDEVFSWFTLHNEQVVELLFSQTTFRLWTHLSSKQLNTCTATEWVPCNCPQVDLEALVNEKEIQLQIVKILKRDDDTIYKYDTPQNFAQFDISTYRHTTHIYTDTLAYWHIGTLTHWHHFIVTLWHTDTLTYWHIDILTHWHHFIVTHWHTDI